MSVNGNGNVLLRYRNGDLLEEVNLSRIKWAPAKGNGKWFLTDSSILSHGTLQENVDVSTPPKLKGYSDDIPIISYSPKELQEIASHVDNHCKDICPIFNQTNPTH